MDSDIVTGGAFIRSRESGASAVRALDVKKKFHAKIFEAPSAEQKGKAMANAQANGGQSPFISTGNVGWFRARQKRTEFLAELKQRAQDLRAIGGDADRRKADELENSDVEVIAIRGPKKELFDFEKEFVAIGGRVKRFKDADMKEMGILDLYVPANGRNTSGFYILLRER